MTETFLKLKKKYLTIAISKSLIAGVFFALFAVGTVMLGFKLGEAYLSWYYYLVIALGTFAVSFVVTFLLTRHSDKSLAKLLDGEYGLNEKVQTMVEFAGQDGDILNLQRADTEETLKNLPKQKIKFSKIWQYIVITVLGLSFFLVGVIVPSRYVAPVVPDEYVVNEWDLKSLDQLIADVQASDLEERVMLPVVSALELLKEDLGNTKTNSGMRTAVKNCATAIDTAVNEANSYREVAKVMSTSADLKSFTTALINAADSYKSDTVINSLSVVRTEQKTSEGKIRDAIGVFTNTLVAKVKSLTEMVEIKDAVEGFVEPLNDCLGTDEVQEQLGGDELYSALSDFSTSFGIVLDEYMFRDDLKSIVSNACTDFVTSASKVLVKQVYNRMMNDMIFNSLEEIFGVTLTQSTLDLPGISSSGNNSDDDNGMHGGGTGDGNVIYGGDDAVYDPESKEHVAYGEVWSDYVARLNELLNDKESGLSEEMKVYIQNYIDILDGSASNTEGEN